MMAGSGVSAGGAGMLRARRRDVSVKPNRKLDRKSSRGMIYENEELRLRTIHINAEVEQGQNDIKKLRKENEQLRREIWSLRDEYDKLEDILKNQKNREGSEEHEDRSEGEDQDNDEDAEECSDYSDEDEDVSRCEGNEDGAADDETQENQDDQEERLENAENQKISSEKMNNTPHRLHVEFDDLSVVDEEEELKKDKERKDAISSEEKENTKNVNDPNLIQIDRSGYGRFPALYGSPGAPTSSHTYYPECPFVFPNSNEARCSDVLSIDPMSLTPCPGAYEEENLCNSHLTYGTPLGWQSNIYSPTAVFPSSESYQSSFLAAQTAGICVPAMFAMSNQSAQSPAPASISGATNIPHRTPIDARGSSSEPINPTDSNATNQPSLSQRRHLLRKQPTSFYRETLIPSRVGGLSGPNSAEALTRNGWDFGPTGENPVMFQETKNHRCGKDALREISDSGEIVEKSKGHHRFQDSTNVSAADRPKHFFAPLPAKIQHPRQDSNDKTAVRSTTNTNDSPSMTFFENYGTGQSSSSDRTNSTVVSAKHFQHSLKSGDVRNVFDDTEKGSADICVNGAIPAPANLHDDFTINDPRTYKSSENLLLENDRNDTGSSRQSSNNPLIKSLSCQNLTSELMQSSLYDIGRPFNYENAQKFTKSDNTLDNPAVGSSKPFRSQLNVTLKCPNGWNLPCDSPNTPEIPELPSIDYRLFSNPFLKSFEPIGETYGVSRGIRSPLLRPLSIQVSDNTSGKPFQQPAIDYSSPLLTHSFTRRLNPDEKALKSTRTTPMTTFGNEAESDRHRVLLASTSQPIDPRIIRSPKHRQEFQVTSFEEPKPRCLHHGVGAFDVDSIRRIPAGSANAIIQNRQELYQNVPFVPGAPGIFYPPPHNPMEMFYDNQTLKVPAQTQTSIDGGSNNEDEADEATKNSKTIDTKDTNVAGSPTTARRKKNVRKERSNQTTEKRPLSPAAQRRKLRKQTSVGDGVEVDKIGGKSRKFSPTTTSASEHLEDKNESRSSSSGQESPRKDQNRRVSLYFNNKKRPSLASLKTNRSTSIDNNKDGSRTRGGEAVDTTNSERERTNSASSREAASGKARKSSVSSGKVPWCACWGNGCI